jgi:hypothetical protein
VPQNGRMTSAEMAERIRGGASVLYVDPKTKQATTYTRAQGLPTDEQIFADDPESLANVQRDLERQRADLDRRLNAMRSGSVVTGSGAPQGAPLGTLGTVATVGGEGATAKPDGADFGLPAEEPEFGDPPQRVSFFYGKPDGNLLAAGVQPDQIREVRDLEQRSGRYQAAVTEFENARAEAARQQAEATGSPVNGPAAPRA